MGASRPSSLQVGSHPPLLHPHHPAPAPAPRHNHCQVAITLCSGEHMRVLVLGLGIGAIPATLLAVRPAMEVDVVELDPAVIEGHSKHIGLQKVRWLSSA